jgi:hypothetical protein
VEAFLLPALVAVPALVALVWSAAAARRATAARRWTPVAGRVVAHETAADGTVDVVEYPLPEGGSRTVRPEPHGDYVSGRPLGTRVPVWRDPVDALNAVLELPRLDRFAGPLLTGILGAFFFVGALVWAALILALVSR